MDFKNLLYYRPKLVLEGKNTLLRQWRFGDSPHLECYDYFDIPFCHWTRWPSFLNAPNLFLMIPKFPQPVSERCLKLAASSIISSLQVKRHLIQEASGYHDSNLFLQPVLSWCVNAFFVTPSSDYPPNPRSPTPGERVLDPGRCSTEHSRRWHTADVAPRDWRVSRGCGSWTITVWVPQFQGLIIG